MSRTRQPGRFGRSAPSNSRGEAKRARRGLPIEQFLQCAPDLLIVVDDENQRALRFQVLLAFVIDLATGGSRWMEREVNLSASA